ncbi:MAG: hypothetical protein SFT90_02900 [Rickettsiales bacterium]|nr:hypothetical protein [Rickettsiales bacterium]
MKTLENTISPSILRKSLDSLKKSKNFCEISLEHPSDAFLCQILDVSEIMILARKILPDSGGFDGFSLLFYDNLATLSWEGELLEQLEILLEEKSKNNANPLEKISNINIHNHFFKVIKTINSLFGHISVYDAKTANDFYFGQVQDIDEEFMLLRLIGDKYSYDDRKIIIRLADIGRIDFGGVYDENMLKLHKIKKTKAR